MRSKMYSFSLNSNIFSLPFLRFAGPESEKLKSTAISSFYGLRLHPKMGREITHLDSELGFSLILKDVREKPFLSDLVFSE